MTSKTVRSSKEIQRNQQEDLFDLHIIFYINPMSLAYSDPTQIWESVFKYSTILNIVQDKDHVKTNKYWRYYSPFFSNGSI